MGLDMYLYADLYVSDYVWQQKEEADKVNGVLSVLGLERGILAPYSPHLMVSVCVAYWRKANAIHGWFVGECQNDVDDCGKHYVERNQLVDLRDLASRAAEEYDAGRPDKAVETLAPKSGFFFGSTDPDEEYRGDLQDTVDQLTKVLFNPKLELVSFYYHSSW